MPRAIVNLAAGDSPAGLILRQKADIERLEAALREARPYVLWCMEDAEADDVITATEVLGQIDTALGEVTA